MIPRPIALIGHSGCGKSMCFSALGGSPMDDYIDTSEPPTLDHMVGWMLAHKERRLITVSVHKVTLNEMAKAKQRREKEDFFDSFLFVYLRCDKSVHLSRMEKQKSEGGRPNQNPADVMAQYDAIAPTFEALKDVEINTTYLSEDETREIVRRLLM